MMTGMTDPDDGERRRRVLRSEIHPQAAPVEADTATKTSAPGPSSTERSSGGRDIVIDTLRGWFIALMILSHVGPMTRVSVIAHLPVYINAASGFVFLSGFVLGMVNRRRIDKTSPREAYLKTWSRAGQLWMIHCVLVFAVFVFQERTGLMREVPPVEQLGGWWNVLWMVPTLHLYTNNFMNILPMYILFIAATPLAVEMIRRRVGWAFIVPSFLLYLIALAYPDILRFQHETVRPQIFSLASWQLVFFSGMFLGYYRPELTERIWRPNRRWLIRTTIVLFTSMFLWVQLHRSIFAKFHPGPDLPKWFYAKEVHGPFLFLYFLTFLVLAYLLIQFLQNRNLLRKPIEWLSTIGRYSLYCFLLHLIFALTAQALQVDVKKGIMMEAVAVLSVAAIFLMAKYRVLGRIIPN
jgi:hypothetical protein